MGIEVRQTGTRWVKTIVAVAAATMLLAPGAQAARRIPEAAAPKSPRSAPPNPAFTLWQATRDFQTVLRAANPHGLGRLPSPTLGYTGSPTTFSARGLQESYPASYDLRTLGKVTPVRNQGAFGTCWAFAALASLESSSLPGETLALSEDNMVLTSGFDPNGATTSARLYQVGGNADMATAYLVRWGGPVFETDDAYGDGVTPAGLTARRHVQNVDLWPGRTSPTDNDRIKYAVMTYGGADVSMLWSDAAYNSATHSYYYAGTGDTNHDVVVVGWNDSYPAGNFSPAAPGNGAFIVRNSWGASWGESGYFYVSYYDSRFGRQYTDGVSTVANGAYTFEAAQPTTDFTTVYQYDPLGYVDSLGYGAGTAAWGANVFTATADSTLGAVGFYTLAPDTAYEVWEGPSLMSLTKLTSGTQAQMGYHTVAVPSGTLLTRGSMFVVAVKLISPGYAWPLAYECPIAGYSDAASAAPGQSYFSSNGTIWTDLTTRTANANVCLKAYASGGAASSPSPTSSPSPSPPPPMSATAYAEFSADARSAWKNVPQRFTITVSGGSGSGRTICYSVDGGATWNSSTDASVDVPVTTDGAHHVEFYAVDSRAREGLHDAGWINIDMRRPVSVAAAAGVKRGMQVALRYRISDGPSTCGRAAAKLQIRKGPRLVKTIRLGVKATNARLSFTWRAGLARGKYTWRVLATDIAGNTAKIRSAGLVVR
jgi:C1A family cysteine protease